ncbi:hypothetical protein GOARA_068_01020 [Gordonia araii NBRC 100433]|uniref:DUF1697 domain-containing protein n=1 Tax=Gordonia araii NBRC 100433 TaxID=1073574 RepID=G7H6G6_9ACTN|nr:DUF1697 domain-containing protein [Gordonia araii]NNG96121.1 DUF1697 domain-containing protein [Gordonia araii NBRC 100433]GAB11441.1 hypothetical protein GOARA_068_01020 [Gordonia araii NBRC 100433]
MSERVGLIRAVNVGGAKLPMARLRDIAESLGAVEVSTYIASGNLLYTPPGEPAEFDAALEREIEAEFGYYREVISRTPDELAAALAAHPFEVVEPKFSYVYPLTGVPTPDDADALAERAAATEHVAVIGADLHIRYDDGAAGTKLTPAVIKRTLGHTGTGRNLNTVAKLIELARTGS